MQDFDGISVLTTLKSHPVFYDIPVIILAEEINDSLIETCFAYGAEDLIKIPTNEFLVQLRTKSAFEKQSFLLKIQTQRDELKMQKKLANESEERANIIMESIQASLLIIEYETGKVIDGNTYALDMLMYNKSELKNLYYNNIFNNRYKATVQKQAKGIKQIQKETVVINKLGKPISILKNTSEIKIKGKKLLLESFVDITKQKKIQEVLEEQKEELKTQTNEIQKQKDLAIIRSNELAVNEQKLQTIIDTSLSGISIINLQGNFNFTNSIFHKLFNYSNSEFNKMTYFDLLPSVDVESATENHNMLMSGEIKFVEKIRKYVKKDGSYFWGHISASPLIGTNGETEGIVSFLTDIDKLKRSEVKIKKNNKNTQAALTYAKRIQNSLFPSEEYLNQLFPESFILYKPKDVVSGDFYWAKQIDNCYFIAAADCTGHGVPGAFMSLLFISILDKVTANKLYNSAGAILDEVKKELYIAFNRGQSKTVIQDGMDIALCMLDSTTNTCQYAGAYNPLYFFRNGKLTEIKATPMPIGLWRKEQPFVNHEFKVDKNDMFYIFSDGFYDQVGESTNKKFMKGRFRKLLNEINTLPIAQQKTYLTGVLDKWQGKVEQVDDILVVGFKWNINKNEKPINEKHCWSEKTILIAEDNQNNYLIISEILKYTSAKTIWAKNGQDAIDIYDSNPNIDLILMDVLMPIMDGITALETIKEKNAKIPIIVLTALTESEEKSKSFKAGCDNYITKPVNRKELLSTIDKYI